VPMPDVRHPDGRDGVTAADLDGAGGGHGARERHVVQEMHAQLSLRGAVDHLDEVDAVDLRRGEEEGQAVPGHAHGDSTRTLATRRPRSSISVYATSTTISPSSTPSSGPRTPTDSTRIWASSQRSRLCWTSIRVLVTRAWELPAKSSLRRPQPNS